MMTIIIKYIITEWAILRNYCTWIILTNDCHALFFLNSLLPFPLSIYFIWEGIALKRFQIQYGFIPVLYGIGPGMIVHNQSASSLFLFNIVF